MEGLDKRLRLLSKNTRNIFEHGIKSLWNRTSEYVEAGIDRTREYLETASKYVTNTGNRIKEKVEIAKEVMPYALMNTLIFSNSYGRMGYYSAKALISYQTVKQAKKGKIYYGRSNIIVPIIAGAIGSALGFGAVILLGDFNSLNHPYQELHNQTQNLENQSISDFNSLYNQNQELLNQSQDTNNLLQNIDNQISADFTNLNQGYQELLNKLQNIDNQLLVGFNSLYNQLQNIDNQLSEGLQNIGNQLQNIYNQISTGFQNTNNQLNYTNNQLHNIENQLNNIETILQNSSNHVQNENTLEEILFGNNNSYDMSVIQVNSVQIENGTAYIQGITYTGANVILEIPLSYVENSNVNIQEFVNDVQQNGQNAYIAIDRADLQYMNLLNNQNNTPVIAIQPNEQLNIGVMAAPSSVNSSNIDNVLNHLTNYNIVIQDGNQGNYAVYGDPNAFYGYLPSVTSSTGGTVVINFPEGSPYYSEAENMINIADQIINSPNNPNPTNSGAIYTYDIFSVNSTGAYQGFPEYNVGQTYIPLIVLKSGQGNTIISDVSS
jgi:hypothetical protein